MILVGVLQLTVFSDSIQAPNLILILKMRQYKYLQLLPKFQLISETTTSMLEHFSYNDSYWLLNQFYCFSISTVT